MAPLSVPQLLLCDVTFPYYPYFPLNSFLFVFTKLQIVLYSLKVFQLLRNYISKRSKDSNMIRVYLANKWDKYEIDLKMKFP